ncbi:putative signal transduction protein with CBS domains [Gonapodya prolifera JEL478]|uniref:Putative signal transduction protein with CBS domains n=1 Tax=Gonapodya prolifera (strain JEL478) TaxID=1344416 RepID=A0A139AUY4_GONPJ|nr:putative signal transduction protein with CBS domains [Gonapodya prolifera JEL478]|eukprot:KXS20393.1 putative signal transduction protein with CBS domains [Gonapodya prolifera JEL478]
MPKVQDVMAKNPTYIEKTATILEAARLMKEKNTGFLPVSEGGSEGKMVGTITDRDIVLRCVAEDHDAKGCQVSTVMTEKTPIWINEDSDTSEASKLMAEKQVRRLPVISKDKKLVGVVSLGDLSTKAPPEHAQHAVSGVSQGA